LESAILTINHKSNMKPNEQVKQDSDSDSCAFQYFAEGKMIEDTGLITHKEAEAFWIKHREHFIKQCEWGDTAEMAIWIEMDYDTHYHKQGRNIRSDEAIIKNGNAYTLEPVF